jgi:signal recognition particle receptor subunit alpha
VELYGSQLKKPNTSVVECDFDDYFDTLVRDLESTSRSLPERNVTSATEFISPNLGSSLDEPPPLPGLLRGKIHRKSPVVCNLVDVLLSPTQNRRKGPSIGRTIA